MNRNYVLSIKQWIRYGGMAGCIAFGTALIFYQNLVVGCIAAGCAAAVYPLYKRRDLEAKQQQKIALEFKECLYGLVAALRSGRSLEGAFEASLEDMDPELTPVLFHEWQIIIGKLRVNQRIEDALEDFARRSGVEEISSFAQSRQICKRTEGNIAKVIENTAGLLQEKIEIQGEVQVALAKKKMEQKILNVMPVAVLSLLLLLSPDYLAPLYSSFQGRMIMTVCAGLAIASYCISKRMADIAI